MIREKYTEHLERNTGHQQRSAKRGEAGLRENTRHRSLATGSNLPLTAIYNLLTFFAKYSKHLPKGKLLLHLKKRFSYFRFLLIDIYKICRHILDLTHMTNSLLLMPRSHKLFDQPIITAPVCHSLHALFNTLVQICSRLLLSLSSHRMSFLQWLIHLLKASLFSLCSCFLTVSCYFVTTKVYCSV